MRFLRLDARGLADALAAEPAPAVLDVRSQADYEAGHLPGSRNVPLHELGRRLRDLPESRIARVLVIGEPGRRTEAAATWLALVGYVDVAVVEGGVAAFEGALEVGPEPPPPARGPVLRIIP